MMQIQHIMKRYGERQILDDIHVIIPAQAKVAIFGINGSGKTTLLRILSGLDTADSGTVQIPAKNRLCYLPQEPNPNPQASIFLETLSGHAEAFSLSQKVDAFETKMSNHQASEKDIADYTALNERLQILGAAKIVGKAERILRGLSFQTSDLQRSPKEFSGGDRMRIELAKVLLADSDFLILDEPTNHLDIKGYIFIEDYLKNYTGTLLLVTHDRHLLEQLPSHILNLEAGQARLYKGNLKDYEAKVAEESEQQEASSERLQKRIKSVETLVNRFRAKASKAGLVRSRMKMLAKLYDDLEGSDAQSTGSGGNTISALPPPAPSGNPVLKIKDLLAGYSHPIVSLKELTIERGARIGVIGVNGAGKTTLLKTLSGKIPCLGGSIEQGYQVRLAYMEQDLVESFAPQKNVLEILIERCPELNEKTGRSLLGRFLFSGQDVFKPIAVLSGGEKSRLGLACTFGSGANLVFLDEPTNHLDLSAKDALLAICQEFAGTMLVVSHDRDFMDELANHMLAIGPGGDTVFLHGGFSELARFDAETGFLKLSDTNEASKAGAINSTANTAAQDYRKLKKDLHRLEKKISVIESKLHKNTEMKQQLELEMADTSHDFSKLTDLQSKVEKLDQDTQSLEEEWLNEHSAKEDVERLLSESGNDE